MIVKWLSKFQYMWSLLVVLFVLSVFPVIAQADTSTTGSGISFTVKTNLPDNQIDKNNEFYQLKMLPGQKQTVTATVYNVTQKATTVNINVQTASTTMNGTVDYSKSLTNWDTSLQHKLSDFISYPKSITIPAGKSQNISFVISMPKDAYQGILLGGITFNQANSDKSESSSDNANIKNKYAYAVAMMLKESDEQVKPNINLKSIKAGQNNGHNAININLQNDQSLLMSNVKMDAKIYSEKGKKPVYTAIKSDMQIAPNSQFKYPVSLQGTQMAPGKYRLELAVTGTAYKDPKTWHFTKQFTIKRQEAANFNQSDVNVSANTNGHMNLITIIIVVILIVVAIILFILFILKRKQSNSKDSSST
ncbi:DUF916 and DUF3324 domain-containing protein [Leuconostoc inhae]|uniref:DUF916 and DUF3324 domain-containing protein n=1 Tax=Leuconostoc inhae TaxID=178001 RepID=UPI001C7D919F|nr:DUF916 and DUF3324 domain-containing protein [Leuconostoc inhae]